MKKYLILLTTNLPLNKEEFDAMPIVQMVSDLIATKQLEIENLMKHFIIH